MALKEEFLNVLSKIENLALFKKFSARENYIKGGSAYDLHLILNGSAYFEDIERMLEYYKQTLCKKDLLLILGAGDLYNKLKGNI